MEVGRLATQRRRKGEGGLVEGWRDKNSPHSSPEKLKKKPTTGQVVKIGKLYQSYLDPHVPPESELLQRHTVPFFSSSFDATLWSRRMHTHARWFLHSIKWFDSRYTNTHTHTNSLSLLSEEVFHPDESPVAAYNRSILLMKNGRVKVKLP